MIQFQPRHVVTDPGMGYRILNDHWNPGQNQPDDREPPEGIDGAGCQEPLSGSAGTAHWLDPMPFLESRSG
jgi:hypothetical protein